MEKGGTVSVVNESSRTLLRLDPRNPGIIGQYQHGEHILCLCDTTLAAFSSVLPSADTTEDTEFLVKNIGSAGKTLSLILADTRDTFSDGTKTISVLDGETVTVRCNMARRWEIIGHDQDAGSPLNGVDVGYIPVAVTDRAFGNSPFFIKTGYAGIGTINPFCPIDIDTTHNLKKVASFVNKSANGYGLFIRNGDDTRYALLINSADDNTNMHMLFGNGSARLSNSRVNIDTSGNLGLSTTAPRRKIDILDASNPQFRATHTDNSVYTDFKTDATGKMTITPSGGKTVLASTLNIGACLEHADNAAAITAGLAVGDVYRTGDLLKIVH